MTCPNCNGTNNVVQENSRWCTDCGTQIESQCEWTFSYNQVSNYRRVPVYSRIKRFRQWIISEKNELIHRYLDDILDVYSVLEFAWQTDKKKRIYFFNKNCILFFILEALDIELTVKTLKDKERVQIQLELMRELITSLQKYFPFV